MELPFGANRQLFAAAGAASRQYGTAILCFHAGAEAVGLRTLAAVRLIRTLRHFF
jgi:hypothetical protein